MAREMAQVIGGDFERKFRGHFFTSSILSCRVCHPAHQGVCSSLHQLCCERVPLGRWRPCVLVDGQNQELLPRQCMFLSRLFPFPVLFLLQFPPFFFCSQFDSAEIAGNTKARVNGVIWPDVTGKVLAAEFIPQSKALEISQSNEGLLLVQTGSREPQSQYKETAAAAAPSQPQSSAPQVQLAASRQLPEKAKEREVRIEFSTDSQSPSTEASLVKAKPQKNLDDLFSKTKAKPSLYYHALTDEEVVKRDEKRKAEEEERKKKAEEELQEREKRREEQRKARERRSPSRSKSRDSKDSRSRSRSRSKERRKSGSRSPSPKPRN